MSSVISSLRVTGAQPVSVSGTGNSVKYFPAPSNIVPPSISATSGQNGYLLCPGSGSAYVVNGQRLFVDAGGDAGWTVTSNFTSPFVTVGLYIALPNSLGIIPANPTINLLGSTTISGNSEVVVPYPFSLSASLQGSTASGLLQGTTTIQIDNGAATTSVINLQSGINFSSSVPFALLVGVTFSVSWAANQANLYQFTLSA
jgi:hypothetical protein